LIVRVSPEERAQKKPVGRTFFQKRHPYRVSTVGLAQNFQIGVGVFPKNGLAQIVFFNVFRGFAALLQGCIKEKYIMKIF
jgi:hypothetical protein